MEMKILRGGMMTTVQDRGRRGHRAAGVPLSGPMDPFAFRVANALVGNPEDEAALEFTLVGPELEFTSDVIVAVTGAECEGIRSWRPLALRGGERLTLGPCSSGCRGYVAVRGGIDVPLVLGSRSTYLRGSWGGFEGRQLQEGDRLRIGGGVETTLSSTASPCEWQIDPRLLPAYSSAPVVRVIRSMGPKEWVEGLFTREFRVSPHSDRMGVRLMGRDVPHSSAPDLLSSAVMPGTIQVPPDGQPLILMADAQTVGGYPQAGHVICVDLPLVAQLRPGDALRFAEVSLEEAHRLALARDRAMAILREGLAEKLSGFVRTETA